MVIIAAWILVVLGLGHTAVGVVLFKKPLTEALHAGFAGSLSTIPSGVQRFGS